MSIFLPEIFDVTQDIVTYLMQLGGSETLKLLWFVCPEFLSQQPEIGGITDQISTFVLLGCKNWQFEGILSNSIYVQKWYVIVIFPNIILLWRLLHIYLVTLISFISYTKVHLFISISFILQIIDLIHIHFIWFCSYCIIFQPHCIFNFLNQSCLWKLRVSLGKILIQNIYCIDSSSPPKIRGCFSFLKFGQ